jgi:hypothetical protein
MSDPTKEPSVDKILSALITMHGTLCLIEGEEFSSFPENVKMAIEEFNSPGLRQSLVRRLKHPELYTTKG